MKRIVIAAAAVMALSGCVVTDPYYVQPQPVYVQPRPVYVAPPVYYRPAPVYYRPQCSWRQQWNPQYRTYQNVRVCR